MPSAVEIEKHIQHNLIAIAPLACMRGRTLNKLLAQFGFWFYLHLLVILGSGMNGLVEALVVSGDDLYAGGFFTTAGGKESAYLAKAYLTAPSSIAKRITASGDTVTIEFSGTPCQQYDVQRAASLVSPVAWTTVTSSPLLAGEDGSFSFTDNNMLPGMAYYRSQQR
jgi:hypothetical protein